ncbi:hypothetical protein DFH07DRAFT_772845 [Mycena maculata]|uniref:Uncharacterized protein n=1 Tax=Mycena maculata TaxID=230809 RepID=A0AAD7J6S0_9AGAR|nr:hypothetical protein DFH07DRAFT_772845 [Mycena maculata]
MFYHRGLPNWDDYKDVLLMCFEGAGAPSKDEYARRCFFRELFQIRTKTNDVLLMFFEGASAPSKDECARRCFCRELFQIRTKTNDVLLACIKGAGAPSKDERARRCFRRELLQIRMVSSHRVQKVLALRAIRSAHAYVLAQRFSRLGQIRMIPSRHVSKVPVLLSGLGWIQISHLSEPRSRLRDCAKVPEPPCAHDAPMTAPS